MTDANAAPTSAATREKLAKIPGQQQEWPGTESALDPQNEGASNWVGRGRLQGKQALITGGDSGIGRAVAVLFAKEGADVVVAHLAEEADDAAETKRLVEAEGRACHLVPGDLREHAANVDLAKRAVEALGGLDVLVCNAAYQMKHDSFEEFPPEQFQRVVETNLLAPMWLCQQLLDELENGGNIIITTSVQAYSPSETLIDYAATKSALTNFVMNLAQEVGPRGIRVNAVAPGPIWTPLIPATMPVDEVEEFGIDTPLGRAGAPEEVAAAYVFLASEEASYVSAAVLGVTGGKPVF